MLVVRVFCKSSQSRRRDRPEESPAGGESSSRSPDSFLRTGRTGRWNREETPMLITGLVALGVLLVGACSWHLLRRYKSRV